MFDELIDVLADRISERVCDHITAITPERSGQYESIPINEKRLYSRLRSRMNEYGMDHAYFAKKINISTATLSKRMNARQPWLITEIYRSMDVLQIPYDRMHEYFPKDGKS